MHTHLSQPFDDDLARLLIREHRTEALPRLQQLWDYYRNDLQSGDARGHRGYHLAQQRGLPKRLTDHGQNGAREIVIENDIAWRVHTLVDFMFGKPLVIQSKAADPTLARTIEQTLRDLFDAHGGESFFQELALLGSVYGYVDVLVRFGSRTGIAQPSRAPSKPSDRSPGESPATDLLLETVEAPRAIPVLDPADYRRLVGYILHYTQTLNEVDHDSFLSRLVDWQGRSRGRQSTREVTEIWTADSIRTWHDGQPVSESPNPLGTLPVVHIQNLPQPYFYEGLSEVEPLIPLQDELNTRLSDRANRVTLQSFKMYLGKGIEGFTQRPIAPGQMWMTDNLQASIEAFGGDAASPSEESHIEQLRAAMDKASGVTPVAAGVLRAKVGNLTSENALRITLMGLLSKTERKRVTYGRGIARLCELILQALDCAGVLRSRPQDRRVELHWPSPLPENTIEKLQEAQLKLDVGVPQKQVLAELGYGETN